MLPISFSTNAVPRRRLVGDIQVVEPEPYRKLVYTGVVAPHQVPISFVGMPPLSPANIDLENLNELRSNISIFENSMLSRHQQVELDRTFNLASSRALITDVVAETSRGLPRPLWYKHNIESPTVISPVVTDLQGQPVPAERWAMATDNDGIAIFHDLETVARSDGSFTAYFLQYSTPTGTETHMLQSDPAYSEQTHLDIGSPGLRRYTTRDRGTSWEYVIRNLGSQGPWYVRPREQDQIKVLSDLFLDSLEPWYLRVSAADIFGVNQSTMAAVHYSIPEYRNQVFAPIEPYVFLGLQRCRVLDENYVQVPNGGLVFGGEQAELELLVMDESGQPKKAYTSSTAGNQYFEETIGGRRVFYRARNVVEEGVSAHRESGLIYLSDPVEVTDLVYVKVTTVRPTLRYIGLNVNPIYNRAMSFGRAFLYCLEASSVGADGIALQHLVLDQKDNIIQWSDVSNLGAPDSLIAGYVGDSATSGFAKFLALQPDILQVASITLNANGDPNSLGIIDVRRPGGVVLPEIEEAPGPLLYESPELQWAMQNSLSGRGVPLHMAAYARVPFSVTEAGGGVLSAEDVETKLSESAALGTAIVIDYIHDGFFDIAHVEYDSATDKATVHFTDLGAGWTYVVYSKTQPFAEQVRADAVTAASTLSGAYLSTEVTVSSADAMAWIEVAPVKDGTEWPRTREVTLTTGAGGSFVTPLNAIWQNSSTFTTPLNAIWEAA